MFRKKTQFVRVSLKNNPFFSSVKDVILFISITVIIHFIWILWEYHLEYKPFSGYLEIIHSWMSHLVALESSFLLQKLAGLLNQVHQNKIYINGGTTLEVFNGCSGIKQVLQFQILILLIRGSLFNKVWFIPLGAIIMHMANIIRITGLVLVLLYRPGLWNFFHDWFFKIFFYAIIFLLWLLWIEYIRKQKKTIAV